ncbi:UPF0755 protein [Litorimonas taeanensis]|uniref:Endolytic murein transglycosylase n=1 Tax=Litorimonas taeanensis TaxID=568099 RepID=A0A420WIL9_9PROT|nr:endolytic transglycosylase MltG [Litorimonas taeanensis]RKQ70782.1 UPF0755 protein [Litorimonas taeanensis]
MARDSKPKKKLAKRDKRLLWFIGLMGTLTVFIGCAIAAYAFINYKYEAKLKLESPREAVVFEVPKGSGLSLIASRLEKQELISNAFLFKLVTKMRGNEAKFKAGEFLLTPGASMAEVYTDLAEGQAILYPVTIAEGLASLQVMAILDDLPELIDDNPPVPVEGSLLPETYLFPRGMKQSELIAKMKRAQRVEIDRLWKNRAEGLPITTKEQAIILASVVEKETGVGSERDEVAGVFVNRLHRGMRLQSDPTIIYGITKGLPLGRRIYRSEINRATDWNTYQIPGLPKTPICNPGKEALAAVLNPAQTKNLYFVADGTGGHAFAQTLAGHERNVAKWRRVQRARGER